MNAETKAKELLREITTHSAEETIAFGRTLKELLAPPKLVLLRGDLGAGKTTLVKGIAAAFEAASEENVTSPTFTLVHEYRDRDANLYHIDLYRIDTSGNGNSRSGRPAGQKEHPADRVGRKVSATVAPADVEIALERAGKNERQIKVRG